MKVDLVVDVGNSRLKWGLCSPVAVTQAVSLAADPKSWQRQLELWERGGRLTWAVAGVDPARCDEITAWIGKRGDQVLRLENQKLPLRIDLPNPNGVGIDRLLNAVAARGRILRRVPIVIIDAGTAVTVDRVNAQGGFEGGAILPGLGLMARALHKHTALLPEVRIKEVPGVPGTATEPAIQAGVFWAVAGGIKALLRLMKTDLGTRRDCQVLLTGGDAPLLATVLDPKVTLWPTLTLEGIRLSAEALP
jgi:type III pantothenate kinase